VHEDDARGRVVDEQAVEERELVRPADEPLPVARCESLA
jgi:hypothetical protein